MASVTIKKTVEVTIVITEDTALALLAIQGRVAEGSQYLDGLYDTLHAALREYSPEGYLDNPFSTYASVNGMSGEYYTLNIKKE